MSRLTLSDIVQAQEAMIDTLMRMHAETLAALTDKGQPRTASETVKIARSGTGDHSTAISVEVVPQDGEKLEDAQARAMVAYEQICARYPMANGYAHASALDGEEPTLRKQLEDTLNDEVGAKRRGKDSGGK